MKYTEVQQIRDLFKKHYYTTPEVETLIDAILACALYVNMKGDPIWLGIVGASSSGKTELLNILAKTELTHYVSTITENTFLSSMRNTNGKENSLLHRIGPRGMIIFKDFTTFLSMRPDKRDTIFSQLREIYDGRFSKESGNGICIEWIGKMMVIFAATDEIYSYDSETAGMGRRNIYYEIPLLDFTRQVEMGKTSQKILHNIDEIRNELQDAVAELLEHKTKELTTTMPEISQDIINEILYMSSFVSLARAGIKRDFRGNLIDANYPEGITRFSNQLINLLKVMMFISNKKEPDEEYLKFIFKICIDSIPKNRRMALMILAEYKNVTAKGVSIRTHRPTASMRMALEELNAHMMVERQANPRGIGSDFWSLKDMYKYMIIKYMKIDTTNLDKDLDIDDEDTDTEMSSSMKRVMGITDDDAYNKELEESKLREDNKLVKDLKIIGRVANLKNELIRKQWDFDNLDDGFNREQNDLKKKYLSKEIEEIQNTINELEKTTQDQPLLLSETKLDEF